MIRLEQIKKSGIVTITNDEISIIYEFSDNASSFTQSTTTYKRYMSYDELVSLYYVIDLLPDQNLDICIKYQKNFNKAIEFQKEIRKLYNLGEKIVFEGHKFFDLIGKNEKIMLD